MFDLADSWVWDFWIVDDGERYHAFFLYASRALHDPDLRHGRASVGHAVSDDLVTWSRIADALVHGEAGDFDATATWTGCVVPHPAGGWRMFYTGARDDGSAFVQSVGAADSDDLVTWHKRGPLVDADPRWYETAADATWPPHAPGDVHWRDPWVEPDPEGGWRMLITARANTGDPAERGVIGCAWSPDLETWEVRPPLTAPGRGFGQLEVPQHVRVQGQDVLLVNCLAGEMAPSRRAAGATGGAVGAGVGGVWAMPTRDDAALPWDPAEAYQLTGPEYYVGKIVTERGTGRPVFLAFGNEGVDGRFVGGISDPMPVRVDGDRVRVG